MKTNNNTIFTYLIVLSSLFILFSSCTNNSKHINKFSKLQHNLVSADSSVFIELSKQPTVYYFHYTRRCITCNAVEEITKKTLAEFYGNKVSFYSLNLDEEKGKEKSKELQVSGQTLLIVVNDKHINLTNEAFMNAKSNREKLKNIIKATIDPFLKE